MSEFIGFLIVLGAGLLLGLFVANGCRRELDEHEAIDAGVAEYYIDQRKIKSFRWKTNEVAK